MNAAEDPEAARAALTGFQPTGRLVTADEVAGAIAYLASPLSGRLGGHRARRGQRHARPAPAA